MSSTDVSSNASVSTPLPKAEEDTQKVTQKSLWNSHDTLLLFSIVHMMREEETIDWEVVSKKLHACTRNKKKQNILTPTECEERYLMLLKVSELNLISTKRMTNPIPGFVKREHVIQTVTQGLLTSSQSQEKTILEKIKQLSFNMTPLMEEETEKVSSDESTEVEESDSEEPCFRPSSVLVFDDKELETIVPSQSGDFANSYASCFHITGEPYQKDLPSPNMDEFAQKLFSVKVEANVSPTGSVEIKSSKPTRNSESDAVETFGERTPSSVPAIGSRLVAESSTAIPPSEAAPPIVEFRPSSSPIPSTALSAQAMVNVSTSVGDGLEVSEPTPSSVVTVPSRLGGELGGSSAATTTSSETVETVPPIVELRPSSPPISSTAFSAKARAKVNASTGSGAIEGSDSEPTSSVPAIRSRLGGASLGGGSAGRPMITPPPEPVVTVPSSIDARPSSPAISSTAFSAKARAKANASTGSVEIKSTKQTRNSESDAMEVSDSEPTPSARATRSRLGGASLGGGGGSGSSTTTTPSETAESTPLNVELRPSTPPLSSTAFSAKVRAKANVSPTGSVKTKPSKQTRNSESDALEVSDSEPTPSSVRSRLGGGSGGSSAATTTTPSETVETAPPVVEFRPSSPPISSTAFSAKARAKLNASTGSVKVRTKSSKQKRNSEGDADVSESEITPARATRSRLGGASLGGGGGRPLITPPPEPVTASSSIDARPSSPAISSTAFSAKVRAKANVSPTGSVKSKSSKQKRNSESDAVEVSDSEPTPSARATRSRLGGASLGGGGGSGSSTTTTPSETVEPTLPIVEFRPSSPPLSSTAFSAKARAKANASSGSVKIRTKSSKQTRNSEGDTAEISDSERTPSARATRSRLGGASLGGGSSTTTPAPSIPEIPSTATTMSNIDAEPGSPEPGPSSAMRPARPSIPAIINPDDEIKDLKNWKTTMVGLINRIGQQPNASIFNAPAGAEELAAYKKRIKKPVDLSIIKKNLEAGVIKTMAQLRRDLNLMFMNLIMFNNLPGPTDGSVETKHLDIAACCNQLSEEFRNAHKSSNLAAEAKERERRQDPEMEMEPREEIQNRNETTPVPEKKSGPGRKRRKRTSSTANSEVSQEKRRTLRTSTTAATSATSSWQTVRQKKMTAGSPDIIAGLGRGRQD